MKDWKKWLIIPPVVLGIVLFLVMKQSKKEPSQIEAKERVRAVRVIPASKVDVVPRAIGYGYVEPGQTWEGIAEVGGKVVEIGSELKKGYFVKKGTVLLRLDTTTYGLAETRGRADVMNIDAQLKELEQNKKNTERLLATEKRALKLSSRELERKRGLLKKGYISKSEMEKEEKSFLAQQTTVNNLQNSLDLVPARRKALLAQKKSGESTLTDYQLNIEKTEIQAPFNCRISEVNVELDQYASPGMTLVTADGVETAEIPVQLSPLSFADLLPKLQGPMPFFEVDVDAIRKAIGITAFVRIPGIRRENVWEARFSRTSESIDPTTGAITIYVAVDGPYEDAVPGKRPPLVKNMYCEVELRGRAIPNRIVIPRSALHEGAVYVANKENRLEKRPIVIESLQGDLAIIGEGLAENDTVVVTDVVPAIEGMLLKPSEDSVLLAELLKKASGEVAFK